MFINSILQSFVFGGLSKRPAKKNDTVTSLRYVSVPFHRPVTLELNVLGPELFLHLGVIGSSFLKVPVFVMTMTTLAVIDIVGKDNYGTIAITDFMKKR